MTKEDEKKIKAEMNAKVQKKEAELKKIDNKMKVVANCDHL